VAKATKLLICHNPLWLFFALFNSCNTFTAPASPLKQYVYRNPLPLETLLQLVALFSKEPILDRPLHVVFPVDAVCIVIVQPIHQDEINGTSKFARQPFSSGQERSDMTKVLIPLA